MRHLDSDLPVELEKKNFEGNKTALENQHIR